MSRLKNRMGERHGRLRVIWYQGNRRWLTLCDCGRIKTYTSNYLHHAAACGVCGNVRAEKPTPHTVALGPRDESAAAIWGAGGRPVTNGATDPVVPPLAEPDVPAPPRTGRGSQSDLYFMAEHNPPPPSAADLEAFHALRA